jgi:hypothetical protein
MTRHKISYPQTPKQEIFQMYFAKAKKERDSIIESLNLSPEQVAKLNRLCELYFAAGQNNNF